MDYMFPLLQNQTRIVKTFATNRNYAHTIQSKIALFPLFLRINSVIFENVFSRIYTGLLALQDDFCGR
jgi:hypothetical protein